MLVRPEPGGHVPGRGKLMTRRFQFVVVTCSTCLLVILLLGLVLGKTNAADDAYRHFSVFTDVISRIKSDYVEEPDMKNVTMGALNGLLEAIDPYASYLTADQHKQYLKVKESRKADVGLIVSRRFGYIGIVSAIPGSPAAKAGLSTGDVLETIGGIATRDMPLAFAEVLMAGEPGTTLELSVLRVRRSAEAQKVSLIRAPVGYPAVSGKMLPNDIAYLQAQSLDSSKSRDVAAKLDELQKQGAKRVILDLRDNATGSPEEGLALANLFLDQGLLTYLKGQKVERKDFHADPAKAICKLPLAVVTNRGTAGGAEIAAAALADNKRADTVGERTYGDAALRKALTLDDGSAVILSVAKYYLPVAGKAIQDTGVTPSLAVADAEAPSEDEEGATPQPQAAPKPSEDLPLKKAIEVVTQGLAAAKKSQPPSTASRAPGAGSRDNTLTPATPLNIPRPPK